MTLTTASMKIFKLVIYWISGRAPDMGCSTFTLLPQILVPSNSLTASSASLESSIRMKAKPDKHYCNRTVVEVIPPYLGASSQSKHSWQFQTGWRHPPTRILWRRCRDLQCKSRNTFPLYYEIVDKSWLPWRPEATLHACYCCLTLQWWISSPLLWTDSDHRSHEYN